MIAENSDKSLLERLKKGDEDAATALFLRYARRLEELANTKTGQDVAVRVDPEGIVQSVFRTFFRRASLGRYQVAEGEELWKLLLVIALNKIRNRASFHRADRRNVARTRSMDAFDSASDSLDDGQALTILKMTIEEVMHQMTESQQSMVALRIQGMEVAEIATETKSSKRTVERTLQNFRKKLAKVIDDDLS